MGLSGAAVGAAKAVGMAGAELVIMVRIACRRGQNGTAPFTARPLAGHLLALCSMSAGYRSLDIALQFPDGR
jgi:hypothetical protein